MSLLLAAAVTLVPATAVDLSASQIYISRETREAIAAGEVPTLSCVELPKRSRKFRIACVTATEWQKAARYAEVSERARRLDSHVLMAQNFASERFIEDRFSLLPP